jgi:sugar lactone lactonase YvrE
MSVSLSSLSINVDDHDDTSKSAEAVSPNPDKPLLDKPCLTATIDAGYRPRSVSCHSEEKLLTCGSSNAIEVLNPQGELQSSVQTKSRKVPEDIAVTRDGDIVYTDPGDRTVNLVKNEEIRTLITLKKWKPMFVCCTASDDLLVVMVSDHKLSKIVRYSGSTEKQSIQYDDQGILLYSADYHSKYICENRNLDICMADSKDKAVVVVDQTGKLRFRYTGHSPSTKKSFSPNGIATDSQSRILTANVHNGRIHILDQDGQFLRYIQNCDLRSPWGICVDNRDNLFVAEYGTGKVKKIQYV